MPNKQYHCDWCHHEFKQFVRYEVGHIDPHNPNSKGKKGSISDQVKCPKCYRLIPTWHRTLIGERMVRERR